MSKMYYPEGDDQWGREIEIIYFYYIYFLHGADINLLMQNTGRRYWQYILRISCRNFSEI